MHWIVIISFFTLNVGGGESNVKQKVYPQTFNTPAECKVWQELLAAEAERSYGTNRYVVQCYGLDSGAFEQ